MRRSDMQPSFGNWPVVGRQRFDNKTMPVQPLLRRSCTEAVCNAPKSKGCPLWRLQISSIFTTEKKGIFRIECGSRVPTFYAKINSGHIQCGLPNARTSQGIEQQKRTKCSHLHARKTIKYAKIRSPSTKEGVPPETEENIIVVQSTKPKVC